MSAMHEVIEAHAKQLTPRRAEVFRYMVQGMELKATADRMFVTRASIREHVTKILKLFGQRNQRALLASMIQEALRKEKAGLPYFSNQRVCQSE